VTSSWSFILQENNLFRNRHFVRYVRNKTKLNPISCRDVTGGK